MLFSNSIIKNLRAESILTKTLQYINRLQKVV